MEFVKGPKGYRVLSDSGNEYDLYVTGKTMTFCTCWAFKTKHDTPCKHMRSAMTDLGLFFGEHAPTPSTKVNAKAMTEKVTQAIEEHVAKVAKSPAFAVSPTAAVAATIGLDHPKAKPMTARFQLAEKYDEKKHPLKHPHVIEPKLDGIRAMAVVKDGKVTFYARPQRDNPDSNVFSYNVGRVAKALLALPVKSAVYDMELYAGSFKLTTGVLKTQGSHPDAHKLYATIFDVIPVEHWEAGFSRFPQAIRYANLREILAQSCDVSTEHGHGVLVLVPEEKVSTKQEVWAAAEKYHAAGYEGGVLKDPEAPYKGTRNWAWQKVKFTETYDVVVTGAVEGKGKFVGTLGALQFDFNGVPCEVGTGFDNAERDMFWQMDGHGKGKTIEVKAQEITEDGSMRFPSYVRLRNDK